MKRAFFIFFITILIIFSFLTCKSGKKSANDSVNDSVWPADLPVYDHIVIIVEENKGPDLVIGNSSAPYINNTLVKEGASFSQMYGEEHPSQGNYFWLFSGSNHNVGFFDNPPLKPINASNLGEQIIKKFKDPQAFKGYSESLPSIGFTGSKIGLYARKHVPWISFANVPNGVEVSTSSNLRFEDFPKDFKNLPKIAFVIPNLVNDMHNGNPPESVFSGDKWLQKNIDAFYQWAKKNNSLLIITFDEDSDDANYFGLTNPADKKIKNQIVTIFAGAHIKAGVYPESKGITHVNILRTLEAMYGLQSSGSQQSNAVKAGITNEYFITDVFQHVR